VGLDGEERDVLLVLLLLEIDVVVVDLVALGGEKLTTETRRPEKPKNSYFLLR
jgi:hypothetical protein